LKDEQLVKRACDEIRNLFRLFVSLDATQVEINPFGVTPDKRVVCFDAKIQFDENANFRQNWMEEAEREHQSIDTEREQLAKKLVSIRFV
jgi:succinyl-CoA synthetase beta subunit